MEKEVIIYLPKRYVGKKGYCEFYSDTAAPKNSDEFTQKATLIIEVPEKTIGITESQLLEVMNRTLNNNPLWLQHEKNNIIKEIFRT